MKRSEINHIQEKAKVFLKQHQFYSNNPISVSIDGIRRTLTAGSRVVLHPGESICLEPYMYHRFWAEGEKTLVGEVSVINDDLADNRFLEPLGRFPTVEEDTEPLHLLVSDYPVWLQGKSQ